MQRVFRFSFFTVDGAVEHDPLAVGNAVDLFLLLRVAVGHREDAVAPLVRHAVELAVELAHGDGLRVDYVVRHRVLVGATILHLGKRRAERLVHGALGAVRVADDHEAVTHDDHFVELRDLNEEELGQLQVLLGAVLLARLLHHVVVGLGEHDPGEQV